MNAIRDFTWLLESALHVILIQALTALTVNAIMVIIRKQTSVSHVIYLVEHVLVLKLINA